MGKKKRPKQETTDLRGYAIRVADGRVFFFNSQGILTSLPIGDAEFMELKDLKRTSTFGPLTVKHNYTVYGLNNRNAFKSAAADAVLGWTMEEFYEMAYQECLRQSTKPHQPKAKKTRKFILQVCDPKVIRSKEGMRITVKFLINSNYTEGDPVEEAIARMDDFIRMAKHELTKLDEFKDVPFDELPNSEGISINRGSFVVKFQV